MVFDKTFYFSIFRAYKARELVPLSSHTRRSSSKNSASVCTYLMAIFISLTIYRAQSQKQDGYSLSSSSSAYHGLAIHVEISTASQQSEGCMSDWNRGDSVQHSAKARLRQRIDFFLHACSSGACDRSHAVWQKPARRPSALSVQLYYRFCLSGCHHHHILYQNDTLVKVAPAVH